MPDTTDPDCRTAASPPAPPSGPVTLINGFTVPGGREDVFLTVWRETSSYFRRQRGFLWLRLNRALSPDASCRFVNIARWACIEDFSRAHQAEAFRALVSRPEWREFANDPALYEEVAFEEVSPADTDRR